MSASSGPDQRAPGRRRAARPLAAAGSAVLALFLLSGSAAADGPQSFGDLLAGFADITGFEAKFEEEKHLSLLAVPLHSRGRLYFSSPGTLLRRVESPSPQDVLIRRDTIVLRGQEGEEVIDLAQRSEVRPLVEALLWLFSGNRTALEEAFHVEFESAPQQWTLRLEPRGESLAFLVRRLAISGAGFGADRVEIFESSGDRSILQILEPDPGRRFSAAEKVALFGEREVSGEVGDE